MPSNPAPDPTRRQIVASEQKKTARLRELRLATEAAGREAGTWGDMGVAEITHALTGAVFVYRCKNGRSEELAVLSVKRPKEFTADEHQALAAWLLKYKAVGFNRTMLAWNLSASEAERRALGRIAEHKAAGRPVMNV